MKFIANTVIIDAFEIKAIRPVTPVNNWNYDFDLDTLGTASARPHELRGHVPQVGDFWVEYDESGKRFLCPKEEFHHKYSIAKGQQAAKKATLNL